MNLNLFPLPIAGEGDGRDGLINSHHERTVEYVSLHAIVRGRVQGVYFRAFVENHAARLGLTGFVRNLLGGKAVEVQAEGGRKQLEALLTLLRVGPAHAKVNKVEVSWGKPTGEFSVFEILH